MGYQGGAPTCVLFLWPLPHLPCFSVTLPLPWADHPEANAAFGQSLLPCVSGLSLIHSLLFQNPCNCPMAHFHKHKHTQYLSLKKNPLLIYSCIIFTFLPIPNQMSLLSGVFNTFSSESSLDMLSLIVFARHFNTKSKHNQTDQPTKGSGLGSRVRT